MEKDVKKPEKAAPKKVYKIRIQFYSEGGAMITRKDLPALIDTTENSVKWLAEQGFKPDDIEVIGEKPASWNDVYPAPEPSPVEKITAVLDGTAPIAEVVLLESAISEAAPVGDPAPVITEASPTKEGL